MSNHDEEHEGSAEEAAWAWTESGMDGSARGRRRRNRGFPFGGGRGLERPARRHGAVSADVLGQRQLAARVASDSGRRSSSRPGRHRRVPAVLRPGFVVPAVLRPGFVVPAVLRPGFVVPAVLRPGFVVPLRATAGAAAAPSPLAGRRGGSAGRAGGSRRRRHRPLDLALGLVAVERIHLTDQLPERFGQFRIGWLGRLELRAVTLRIGRPGRLLLRPDAARLGR